MPKRDVVIYALFDWREPNAFRYVGQTRSMADRLHKHRNPSPTTAGPVVAWARDLGKNLGMAPLDLIGETEDVDEAERAWIETLRQRGHDLLNVRGGGRTGFTMGTSPGPHGEGHHFARLTDEQVAEVRRRAAAGENLAALGREYGYTRQGIRAIVRGRTRKTD